jgi:hypothetical protein
LTIDDGTATATVTLVGNAREAQELLEIGDLINVRGVVTRTAEGGLEIVVDAPTDIEWLDRFSATASPAAHSPSDSVAEFAVLDMRPPAQTGSGTDARAVAAALVVLAIAVFGIAALASPARRKRLQTWLDSARSGLKARLASPRSG